MALKTSSCFENITRIPKQIKFGNVEESVSLKQHYDVLSPETIITKPRIMFIYSTKFFEKFLTLTGKYFADTTSGKFDYGHCILFNIQYAHDVPKYDPLWSAGPLQIWRCVSCNVSAHFCVIIFIQGWVVVLGEAYSGLLMTYNMKLKSLLTVGSFSTWHVNPKLCKCIENFVE